MSQQWTALIRVVGMGLLSTIPQIQLKSKGQLGPVLPKAIYEISAISLFLQAHPGRQRPGEKRPSAYTCKVMTASHRSPKIMKVKRYAKCVVRCPVAAQMIGLLNVTAERSAITHRVVCQSLNHT
jgi:hypothetical protein